jgi:predicted transcriptional regulator
MAVKMTLSLDEETTRLLCLTARRLHQPKSAVVRSAIREYEARSDRLSPEEQSRMLAALERFAQLPRSRSQAEADREIAAIRRARRQGGRKTPIEIA